MKTKDRKISNRYKKRISVFAVFASRAFLRDAGRRPRVQGREKRSAVRLSPCLHASLLLHVWSEQKAKGEEKANRNTRPLKNR
jgi:hypothetical protein